MLSCLHGSHCSSWLWKSESLNVREEASTFVLNQVTSLNDRRVAWDTTCLHLHCQNAVWKEKSKLCGKRPERASWLPKRQSTAGKKEDNALWNYIIPFSCKSIFILQSANSPPMTKIWNIQKSKYKKSCYLRSRQTSTWTASSAQQEIKPHNKAPRCSNPGRGCTL